MDGASDLQSGDNPSGIDAGSVQAVGSVGAGVIDAARRDDRIFEGFDLWGSIAATVLAGLGGFFNTHWLGLPLLGIGFLLMIAVAVVKKKREPGTLERGAAALVAETSARTLRAEAEAIRARADRELAGKDAALVARDGELAELKARLERLTADLATAGLQRQRDVAAQTAAEAKIAELGVLLHKEGRLTNSQRAHRKRMLLVFDSMLDAAAAASRDLPLVQLIEAMLDAAVRDAVEAMGYEPGEKWTFSIFSREDRGEDEVMVRSFARSSDREEARDQRTWARGEGYTGAAWARRAPVVETDTRDQTVASDYRVPPDKLKAADADTYVSVAAVPIFVYDQRGARRVCGCITATSDRAGRFIRDQASPHAQNLDFLLCMERIVAATITLCRDRADGAFKLPLSERIG